jgi:Cd2+/Zn2+-exporting ATPase
MTSTTLPDHLHTKSEEHDHGGVLGSNTELIFALTSGLALGLGFALEKLATGLPAWIPLALFLIAYIFGGFFTVREAFENLRQKRFEIDTLMLVAAAGAAALGAWAEGALLLFLFSIGHALEHYAMGRANARSRPWPSLPPGQPMCDATGRSSNCLSKIWSSATPWWCVQTNDCPLMALSWSAPQASTKPP